MDEFLDNELSKPVDEMNIDKINKYLNELEIEGYEPSTKRKLNRKFKVFSKLYLSKEKKCFSKPNNFVIRKRVLIIAMSLLFLLLIQFTVDVVAGISLFSKVKSLFIEDEFIILDDETYSDMDYILIGDILDMEIIDFETALIDDPNIEYLKIFKKYIVEIAVSNNGLSNNYSVTCLYEEKSFFIKIFVTKDEELVQLSFEESIKELDEYHLLNNETYYYNDYFIFYYDNSYGNYTFYNISFDDLKAIISNYTK